jgi:hypothetical protein
MLVARLADRFGFRAVLRGGVYVQIIAIHPAFVAGISFDLPFKFKRAVGQIKFSLAVVAIHLILFNRGLTNAAQS